jgi:DNA-binding MarR family transcriptional regulator
MHCDEAYSDAERLESLLPEIMRRLFTLDPEHPVTEMPLAQLRVCAVLRESGPQTLTALGERLGISSSAVTQVADRLEKGNYVERVPEAEDRRVRRLRLTRHGAAVMESRRCYRVAQAERVIQRLSAKERCALLTALLSLLEASAASSPSSIPDEL